MTGEERPQGTARPAAAGRGERVRSAVGRAVPPQLAVAIAIAVVAGIALLVAEQPSTSTSIVVRSPSLELVDVAQLRENGLLAEAGFEPYEQSLRSLRDRARDALKREPRAAQLPASLDALRDDALDAWALALAKIALGDVRHGRHASSIIDAWAGTGADRACREVTCPEPWAVSVPATTLLLSGAALNEVGDVTPEQLDRLAGWVARSIPDGPLPEDQRGDAAVAGRLAVAAVRGDTSALNAAAAEWRSRLESIAPSGVLPGAGPDGLPIAETQEALAHRVLAAVVAERRGVLLWDVRNGQGGSLRAALVRLAERWAVELAAGADATAQAGPVWEHAYARWGEPSFLPLLRLYRARGDEPSTPLAWSTLFQPSERIAGSIGDGPPVASASPSTGHPTASSSPPASVAPAASPSAPAVLLGPPLFAIARGPIERDRVPAVVSWSAPAPADPPAGGGDPRYQLELDRESAGPERRTLDADVRRVRSFLLPDDPVLSRLRASTGTGWGPWVAGPRARLDVIEESAARRGGDWQSARAAGYSGGRALYAIVAGASLSFRIEARSFGIRGPVGPTRGRMEVIVDGTRAGVVDLRASTFQPARILFARAWPEPGRHVVEIRAMPAAGRTVVAVDAIVAVP